MRKHVRQRGAHEGGWTVLARLAEWRVKPRYPMDWKNWNENHRFYLTLGLLVFGLVWGGLAALTGMDERGNRLLGLAALIAGVVVAVPIVAYLMRPTKPRPPEPKLRDDLVRVWTKLRRR